MLEWEESDRIDAQELFLLLIVYIFFIYLFLFLNFNCLFMFKSERNLIEDENN